MNTFNNKIFEILSNLVDIIVEDTILEPNPEKKKPNSWYPNYLHNVVIDGYWRDPQRDKLSEAITGITPEKISTSIRLYLNQHDYLGGLKYLAECCGCSEEAIKEFGILYQTPILNSEENEEVIALRLENAALKEEIERLKKLLQTPKKGFSRDNITEESIKSAKVRISLKKSGYTNSYDCLDDLLEAENISLEPTIKNGYSGLVNVLKERVEKGKPEDTFVCVGINGYRVDFIFE